jgi:serum/glucocorticoid-regulated kinase 2
MSTTSVIFVSQPFFSTSSLLNAPAAPYIPPIDPSNASDTQNFDEAFLDMDPIIDTEPEPETQTDSERERSEREESETPSRSPKQLPVDDDADVFDGYSFKGRQSVILDDDDDDDGYDGHAEDEDEDDVEATEAEEEPANVAPEHAKDVAAVQELEVAQDDEKPTEADVKAETPPEIPAKDVVEAIVAPVEPVKPPVPPPKTAMKSTETRPSKAVTIATPRPQPRKREKSGVAALDRHLSRVVDEDEDAGTVTERDDDDWDFVETPGGEDRNGAKGTSLFARGVVDRYRLAVFRKASGTHSGGGQARSFSGVSVESDIGGNDPTTGSPSPSEKRRGRNTGLSIGKSTRQFLRARSPPSTFSSGTRSVSRTTVASSQHTAIASGVGSGLLTPSPSMPTGVSPHSLKSKDSTTSMGSPSGSSDGDRRSLSQSAADLSAPGALVVVPPGEGSAAETGKRPVRTSSGEEPVHKLKKMKKYKEGAEKVLSLFGSPRQERTQPSSHSPQS